MITETFKKVLADEGVAAIVTGGQNGPHVVNTWNSYITLTQEGYLLIPAGRMNKTEANISANKQVLMTVGSRNVQGLTYIGTGFLIEADACFEHEGERFDLMKGRFDWMRAVLVVKPRAITQTL